MRERKRRAILRLFSSSASPLLFSAILSQYFSKKQSTPSLITAARSIDRSCDACNNRDILNWPVLREVKILTYVRTWYVRSDLCHLSKTPMLPTHTADEATLDDKIQSQDSVNVSSAKNLITPNKLHDYYSKLFNRHPPYLIQEQSVILDNHLCYTAVLSRDIKREVEVCPTRTLQMTLEDKRGPALPR